MKVPPNCSVASPLSVLSFLTQKERYKPMRRLFTGVLVTLVLMTLMILSSSSVIFAHQTTRSTAAAASQAALPAASQATTIHCSGTGCDGWDPYIS